MARTKQPAVKLSGAKVPRSGIKGIFNKKVTEPVKEGEPVVEQHGSIKKKKKPHRFRPGTVALKQIKKYQKSTALLIPKAPFCRLVKEIVNDGRMGEKALSMQSVAVQALQEATEAFLTQLFTDSNELCIHAGRTTIQPKDLRLAARMRSLRDE